MTDLLAWGVIAAALGSGLIAGAFFAFSAFVMGALARLPGEQGVAAMQSINIVVINPAFLSVFLGTGILCVALLLVAMLNWGSVHSVWSAVGALLYLVGCLLVTFMANVPMNNRLSRLTAVSSEAAIYWPEYVDRWTLWNHVRVLTALVASGCLMAALL